MVAGLRSNGQRLLASSPAAGRARLEALALPADRRKVTIEPVAIGALAGQWFTPKSGATPETTLLYFHGGGYVLGSVESYRELLARVAVTCRVRVLAVDYRLAPEHPFPAAVDDCFAAYQWALAHGVDAERLFVAGDSSGGGLAIATLLAARDGGVTLPRGGVLLSPWVDLTSSEPSVMTNASFDWGDRAYLQHWTAQYLAGSDARDPRASPLYADLHGLPPLFVHVGTAELLHDEVRAFAERARAAGVDVTLREWPHMVHGWVMLNEFFPDARRTLDEIAAFVDARRQSEAICP